MRPLRQGDGAGLSASGFSEVRKGDGTVLWSAGSDIPDSVVDSFEDESFEDYVSTSDFAFSTAQAYDGGVSIVQSVGDFQHRNLWWDGQTVGIGDAVRVSVWMGPAQQARGGPTLVNSSGDGYAAYADSGNDQIKVLAISEDSAGSDLSNVVDVTIPNEEWVNIVLEFDGSSNFTAIVNDDSGSELGSASASDSTHTPTRHGVHIFDPDDEFDLLEKYVQ